MENKVQKNVKKTKSGVSIQFQGVVQKQNIIKMVENCSSGKCDCMSETTKSKIKDMNVSGVDGDVSLELSGTVTQQEIEEALSKSTVIKG